MSTIKEKEQALVSDFEMFDDWMDKYNYIIEMGRSLPEIEESLKQDKYLIKGCQARVWLHATYRDGKVYFSADSDALITKGIAALLIEVLSGLPPKDVVDADMSFVDRIGLKEHLSQTRSNGLLNMIKQMKLYALAFRQAHQ
ncbi:MAG: SufE family protein [Bacteroidales bacterium]|nr:SufE family protein [Bacteroidales bacterium]